VQCEPGTPTDSTCSQVGLIRCSDTTNECPLFFQPNATVQDDKMSGGVMLVLSIVLLFICLLILVAILSKMLGAVSNRIIYKCSNINGYVGIIVGCGMTVLVQSSSIVTSALTPLVGVGAIRLEEMYELSLGADIGTVRTLLVPFIFRCRRNS
jgi:solute carrier family 34 (sodium-dependent phosphate cotransporter)